ncbi:BA14K family protein [Nordella sp. HKS 07]|uniref:BA14K family protein n=1 Tax=Nordella sp. HKS 07 TaxID=2712222 RepID=UPI0013E1B12B|nr:BA14K family protein [Nordella sp. HKS 07]QIG50441.1 BA14K family protein [Nordella sp. HKS 07]
MVNKPFALAAAALMAGLLGFGSVEAANVATGNAPLPAVQAMPDANVQQVARRYYYPGGGNYYRGGNNYRGGNYYRGGRYYRGGNYYRGGRYYGGYGNYWGGSGIALGLGFAPFFGGYYGGYGGYGGYYNDYPYYYYRRPYYRPYYRPVGNSHVRWCLNRYRSYSPRSDTFMGYDGRRHYCRSPYRY